MTLNHESVHDIDYEVTEGATVYQTVPAEKEVKIQVKPEENNTIDTISCNGDDVENVSDQNTWEETVKFDKDTVKDYKIIFKEVTKPTDAQSQDTSEDTTASENGVVAKESEGAVENEDSDSTTAQENSEQVPESDAKESEEKNLRLKDLNMKGIANKGFGNGKATLDNGWYPSSRTCSICSCVNENLKDLSIRRWRCLHCGTTHDRDVNATLNIKQDVLRLLNKAQ